MNQGRIFPLVGPLSVLYLTAEVVSSAGELDATAFVVFAISLGLSGIPVWLLRREGQKNGAGRVVVLGVALGLSLIGQAQPALNSLYLDIGAALGLVTVGFLSVHLAFDVPDEPVALRKKRAVIGLTALLALACCAASFVAVAPPIPWAGDVLLVPARWTYAAPVYAGAMLLFAALLRFSRRRLGSTPEALAAGGWAQLGIWIAGAAGLLAVGLLASESLRSDSSSFRGLWAFAAVALLGGHVAMLGARRQVRAGRSSRRLISGALALVVVGVVAGYLGDRLPESRTALGIVVAFFALLSAGLHRLFLPLVTRLLSPFSGRLVNGVEEALETAFAATTLEELGAAVLPPLRRASGDLEAEPLLYALDPAREVRVDAASVAHVSEREISPALRERLLESPGQVVVAAPLFSLVVRRPHLRGLVESLERLDALAVVPLSTDEELDGALIVPRGRRRSALTLEEIDGLERLGARVAAQVAMLSAHERSRQRTREAVVHRERVSEELEAQAEEVARLREDAQILKSGGVAERFNEPAIAYSAEMRELSQRVQDVGPVDAPALLLGEVGTELDRVAHRIHAAGGRREGPFVIASCAAVRPERAEAALFGEHGKSPGWLRLADGGTCLLLDVPALSLPAQSRLAEAIATRRAPLADGAGTYPVDVRVIATSRVPLSPLVEVGAFDHELHRRLEPLVLEVPPLRRRAEDVPSLVLLALDRTCRTMGRAVIGVEPAALEQLVAHDWPGNLDELRSVIDRAVARASGANVLLEDLPPLVSNARPDPWAGTYADIEARVLTRAMQRADGNKSEAARLLGLARTTFVDKLKRHSLYTPEKTERGVVAAS